MLTGSLIVPTGKVVETEAGTAMFALSSETQLNSLKKYKKQSIVVPVQQVPVQFRNYLKGEVSVYSKVVEEANPTYSPIGGHYAYYLTQFVENVFKPENLWDCCTRFEDTNTHETQKVRKEEDFAALCAKSSYRDVQRFQEAQDVEVVLEEALKVVELDLSQ